MTLTRRTLLRQTAITAAGSLALVSSGRLAVPAEAHPRDPGFGALEQRHGLRLGVHAWDSRTGLVLAHRPSERFPIMSVFKMLAVAALLRDHDRCAATLSSEVLVRPEDVVANSPIIGPQVGQRVSYAALCDAALRYSDNTAGNLLLRRIGGPAALTRFARSIDDRRTRLDRTEPTLNTAIPGDPRDTTTPADLGHDVARLLLGRALATQDRHRLTGWMLANTTSAKRFRSVLPAGWRLADKTGTGDYGSANDVGVFFRPDGSAVVVAALSTQPEPDAVADDAVLAESAGLVLSAFGD